MTNNNTPSFPEGKFKAILADPPWDFRVRSPKGAGRSASQHYGTMPTPDICALPVLDMADKDCALFLWATGTMLPAAFEVMAAWGFTYKSMAFTWIKMNKDGETPFTGMGFWTRQNAEYVLLGTRGRPKRLSASVHQVVLDKRMKHSRKPDEVHRRIQQLVSGPYIELFARRPFPGWAVWGNEIPAEVMQESAAHALSMGEVL